MGQIKYSYCLDEKNELVHISSVTAENRNEHTYRCIECGQPLIAKIGKIKTPHFAHRTDTVCDGESYLHKLAKRRIREKFMYSDRFPVIFVRDVPCMNSGRCVCFDNYYCVERGITIPSDLKIWQENVVYDRCQEEIRVGEFQPDLLLTCKNKPDRKPVFIEVYKTHKSELSKVSSQYRIIETIKIKTEADIDDIIDNGFIEGQNCQTFNFTPKLPSIRKNDVPIDRFLLFENGAATVRRGLDNMVMCDKLNQRVNPNAVCELNMKARIDIWGELLAKKELNSYQIGLVYLLKKGMVIKNCILCKFYRFNNYHNHFICVHHKSLGAQSPKPKQTAANTCYKFELNEELMKYPLSDLEKEVSEVP